MADNQAEMHCSVQWAPSNGVDSLRDYAYVRVNKWLVGLPCLPVSQFVKNSTKSVQFILVKSLRMRLNIQRGSYKKSRRRTANDLSLWQYGDGAFSRPFLLVDRDSLGAPTVTGQPE